MQNSKIAMHAIKANAAAFASQNGFKLIWEDGFQPRCDSKEGILWLPKPSGLMPFTSKLHEDEAKAMNLAERLTYAFMVHEMGHHRYTRVEDRDEAFGLHRGEKVTKEVSATLHRFFNVIEDLHIEAKMGKLMYGLGARLKVLAETMDQVKIWGSASENEDVPPAEQVMCAMMVVARKEFLGHQLETADEQEVLMTSKLGEKWVAIKAEMKTAFDKLSTEASVQAAHNILDILQDELGEESGESDDSESSEQPGDQQEGSAGGEGAGEGEKEGESDGGANGDAPGSNENSLNEGGTKESEQSSESEGQKQSEKSGGKSGNKEGSDKSEDGGSSGGSGSSGKSKSEKAKEKQKRKIQKFCQDIINDEESGNGEITGFVENKFDENKASEDRQAEEADLKGVDYTLEQHMSAFESTRAEVNAAVLSARIGHLLATRNFSTNSRKMSGTRIDRRGISQMRFNPQIFKNDVQSKGIDTALTMLVDVSGSTRSEDSQSVPLTSSMFEAVVGMSKACEKYGVDVEVVNFNGRFHYIKRKHQKVSAMMKSNMQFGGGTWTSTVMPQICQDLSLSKKKRKVLFLVTDGDVYNKNDFDSTIIAYQAKGIEFRVLHFGKESEGDAMFSLVPHKSVENGDCVPDSIFSLLEEVL